MSATERFLLCQEWLCSPLQSNNPFVKHLKSLFQVSETKTHRSHVVLSQYECKWNIFLSLVLSCEPHKINRIANAAFGLEIQVLQLGCYLSLGGNSLCLPIKKPLCLSEAEQFSSRGGKWIRDLDWPLSFPRSSRERASFGNYGWNYNAECTLAG